MGVSLQSKTRPLFTKCAVMVQVQSVRHTCVQACFPCFFSNPYISPFRVFHLLVSSLFYLFPTNFISILPWVRKLSTGAIFFSMPALAPLGPWHMSHITLNRCIYICHHKLPLDDVNSGQDDVYLYAV